MAFLPPYRNKGVFGTLAVLGNSHKTLLAWTFEQFSHIEGETEGVCAAFSRVCEWFPCEDASFSTFLCQRTSLGVIFFCA